MHIHPEISVMELPSLPAWQREVNITYTPWHTGKGKLAELPVDQQPTVAFTAFADA